LHFAPSESSNSVYPFSLKNFSYIKWRIHLNLHTDSHSHTHTYTTQTICICIGCIVRNSNL